MKEKRKQTENVGKMDGNVVQVNHHRLWRFLNRGDGENKAALPLIKGVSRAWFI